MRRTLPVPLILCSLLFAAAAIADEGMWPLYDLGKVDWDELRGRGLELSPEQIGGADGGGLSRAVVSLGATGSFVSERGLILTNHHVAFGAVQLSSTTEENFLRDGFYAATRGEEIPAIGYHAFVTLGTKNVTESVLGGLGRDMDDVERYEAIEMAIKRIVKEGEQGRDVKCNVAKMFGGTQFVLYTRLDIKDIRIVQVPPESIGKYGGDIDNWMWPRHTGDYSFLRAYVAPDGTSAAFAEENVPYRPDVWLPVSARGVKEGDFAMVIGFPGRTNRYASSYQIEQMVEKRYPMLIGRLEDSLAIMAAAAAANPEHELRLASRMAGLNNFLKNSYGMMEGFEKSDILSEKRKTERRLQRFLREHSTMNRSYGTVLADLKRHYDEKGRTYEKDSLLGSLLRGSDLLGMAAGIHKRAIEREKDDLERERGYQERDRERALQRLENSQINLLPEIDRAMLAYVLEKAKELPEGQRIAAVDEICASRRGCADEFLDRLFAESAMGDLDRRREMFDMSLDELMALGDPFIEFAARLRPELDEREERERRFSGAETRLEPRLIAAYAAWRGHELYPDANGTRRFNPGTVMGFGPSESNRYDHITTLGGMMAKETHEDPFIVPAPLAKAYARRQRGAYVDAASGDVPVNFLTTNDSTGGNSGSPVINGRGELIGLLFDGNYEAIAADYLFEEKMTRSINVDVRYILFLLDEVYGYSELLAELTIR